MPLLLALPAWSADLEVGGPGFPDIESALAEASAGDRLLLHGPSWNGSHTVTVPDLVIEPWPGQTVTLRVDDLPDESPTSNGFFYALGVTLTVTNFQIDGQDLYRVAKVSDGGTLRLVGVEGFGGSRAGIGGAIHAADPGSALELVECELHDNESLEGYGGGAVGGDPGTSITISDSRFESNASSGSGGAVWCNGTCSITHSTFVRNTAPDGSGGAIELRTGAGSEIRENLFCLNSTGQQGGAVAVTAGAAVDALSYNVFWLNQALHGGAVWTSEPLLLHNNDFLDNAAEQQGAAVYASGGETRAVNSIVVDHSRGDELFRGGALTVENVLYFENTIGPVGGGAGQIGNILEVDPEFVQVVASACEASDLHLEPTSPGLGAGDQVLDRDLGAFPVVCPDVLEIPGDDVDQDCDEVDLCYVDADHDGHGGTTTAPGVERKCDGEGESRTGDDCDDAAPDRHPGSTEIAADGIDADCDGLELCYPDGDGDGAGVGLPTATSPEWTCVASGVSPVGTDCDDSDPLVQGVCAGVDGARLASPGPAVASDPGCGCGTKSAIGLPVVALLVASIRRRRQANPPSGRCR